MPSTEYNLKPVNRITTGAFGSPGKRVFYLQPAHAGLLSTIEVEALALGADRLLAERRFPQPGLGQTHPWPLV